MKYSVSCNLSDVSKISSDERLKFTIAILEACGIENVSSLFPSDLDSSSFDVIMKGKLVHLLSLANVSIIDSVSGEQEILVGGNPIAHWEKPVLSYREDASEKNRSKRLFAEIKFSFNSVFEEQPK